MTYVYAKGRDMAFWKGLTKPINDKFSFSLEPGEADLMSLKPGQAHTFSLMKKYAKNQGVECSPKFGLSFLKNKTGTKWSSVKLNSLRSDSLFFLTSSQSKFLTAAPPKADKRACAGKDGKSNLNATQIDVIDKTSVSVRLKSDLLPSEDQGRGASVLIPIPSAQSKLSQSSAEGSGVETLDSASEVERSRIAQRANSLDSLVLSHQGERTRLSANEDGKPCGKEEKRRVVLFKRRLPRHSVPRNDGETGGVVQINKALRGVAPTLDKFQRIMKNKAILLLVYGFVSGLFTAVQAQSPKDREAAAGVGEIKPLQIGDTVPEAIWHLPLQVVNHPDGRDTITLNDYRDRKLIILDFWSSWCSSCLKSFPKVMELAEAFAGEVAILLVNPAFSRDDEIRAQHSMRRALRPYATDTLPMSILGDDLLIRYFPTKVLPHLVSFGTGTSATVRDIGGTDMLTAGRLEEAIRSNMSQGGVR